MLKLIVQPKNIRHRIVYYAHTISNKQNLDLLAAVYNDEKDFYFTKVYFMSDSIKRCDEPDDYTYVLIKNSKIYPIYRKEGRQNGKMIDNVSVSRCPIISKEEAWQLIKFYNDNSYNIRHSLKAYDDIGQEMNNYDLLAYYFPNDFASYNNKKNKDYNHDNSLDSNTLKNPKESQQNKQPKNFVIKKGWAFTINDLIRKYPKIYYYSIGIPLFIPLLWFKSWVNDEEFDPFAIIFLAFICLVMITYEFLKYLFAKITQKNN